MAIVFAAIVVSWVIFIFNFVLGYYMGRAVEAAEQIKKDNVSKTISTAKGS